MLLSILLPLKLTTGFTPVKSQLFLSQGEGRHPLDMGYLFNIQWPFKWLAFIGFFKE